MPPETEVLEQEDVAAQTEVAKVAPEKSGEEKVDLRAADEFFQSLRKSAPKKKAEDKKEADEKADDEKEEKDEAAKDAKAGKVEKSKDKPDEKKVEAKAKSKPARRTEPTAADIGKEIGREIATALKPAEKDKPEEKSEIDELPAPARREYDILKQVEKMFPTVENKNLADRHLKASKAWTDYVQKWTDKHPDEDFDPDAAEHKTAESKLAVDWSDDEYTAAIARIEHEKASKEVRSEFRSELEEIKQREKLRDAEPVLKQQRLAVAEKFWGLFGEGFGEILTNGVLNSEKYNALVQKEPMMMELIYNAEANEVKPIVEEIHKLDNGLVRYDGKNQIHKVVSDFALDSERKMLSQPPDNQYDAENRRFVTREKYSKMPDSQKNEHWTYSADDLSVLWARHVASETNKQIAFEKEKHARWFGNGGKNGSAKPQKPDAAKNGAHEDDADEQDEKPLSPSNSGTPKLAAKQVAAQKSSQTSREAVMNKFFPV